MKKIEIIFGLTALIAAILSLFDYPMSTQLLIVSIGNLSIFYMYLSIPLFNAIPARKMFSRASYEGISKGRFIGSLALGLTFSAALIGLLFKLMIWPNALVEMLIALLGLLIALAVSIQRYRLKKDSFYLGVFKRIAIFLILVVVGIAIPKYAVLEFKYADYPKYIEAFKARNEQPNDKELLEKLEEERQVMLEQMLEKNKEE